MTEQDSLETAERRFAEFLVSIGGSVRARQRQPSKMGPDLVIEADVRGKLVTIIAEYKSQGEPRYLRQAADQLREFLRQYPTAYPVILTPYLTEKSAALLDSKRVGYFDLAGNALIDYGPIFIRVAGKARQNRVGRKLKSLFAPRSARILRVMLLDPKKHWLVQDLAKEAKVSIGLVSKVKQKLRELELGADARDMFVDKPGQLLDEWVRAYRYDDNQIERYYSPLDLAEIEGRLAITARSRALRYALTMFSGAWKIAPFVRYNFASFYYSGKPDELAKDLKIKSVSSGANVWVFKPVDEGIYYGLQEVGGLAVASNLQLYLDLVNFKGRGEEQAAAIREQFLGY